MDSGPTLTATSPDAGWPDSQAGIQISAVIAVYNSAELVGETIRRTVDLFERHGWRHEVILVNDGSTDGSWNVVRAEATARPHVVAIDLQRNYGQHTALLCGLQRSRGTFVVTLDDDLQNPPEEITQLLEKAREGYDVVFGRSRKKRHSWVRRGGSWLVRWLESRMFGRPRDLVPTNFRIMRRDVVDRVCAHATPEPYLRGLILQCATRPVNVWVDHHARASGRSGYTPRRLASFLARILISDSAFPLHVLGGAGVVAAVGLLIVVAVAWTSGQLTAASLAMTIGALLLFLVTLLMLSLVGEHIVRLRRQLAPGHGVVIREVIGPSSSAQESTQSPDTANTPSRSRASHQELGPPVS